MGFLEYAGSMFLDKDFIKTKLLVSGKHAYSQLTRDKDGFACIFPEPIIIEGDEQEAASLMGYEFPADELGKRQLLGLFRASVFHLSAHAMLSNLDDYVEWSEDKDERLAEFATTIIEDVRASAYISSHHPEKLGDLAAANTLALKRLRRVGNFRNPATRIMVGLLFRTQTGTIVVNSQDEKNTILRLAELLTQFRERMIQPSADAKTALRYAEIEAAGQIYDAIENAGTITEAPFLPHTEGHGKNSVFLPSYFVNTDVILESDFAKCLEFLGGKTATSVQTGKLSEAEALQVFDSWKRQKERDQKITSKYEELLSTTRFRSVEIPDQDYTEFLRVKARSKSEANRLMESLLVARDAIDEDPRKNYGVLDLQDVIQVLASKSPRMDVFMLDENISKSYSWIILLDASRSMEYTKDFALEIFHILGQVANDVLLDPTSWGMYAFNDRFFIIKDLKERYNARVKSRLGGLKFEGFTYMPDALAMAGQILKTRAENLRLITVISDGWPYGYSDMDQALSAILDTLAGKSISVIGIGMKTHRMDAFFKSNCPVYTLRDLTKKFSTLYFEASNVAVGT